MRALRRMNGLFGRKEATMKLSGPVAIVAAGVSLFGAACGQATEKPGAPQGPDA
jgi:hypothetical protein